MLRVSTLALVLVSQLAATPDREPEALAVVAPAAWEKSLAPFIEARSAELRVEFMPLESTLASREGCDAAERLKRALYVAFQQRGLRYALLVGDADTLPVRFMVLDRKTEPAFDYAFYASDLYYADLVDERGGFEDWNDQREGFHARYFGEVRGEANKGGNINFDAVSYVPEIAVGRWPVSSADQVAAVVAKTLAWKPATGPPRALFVHADGWIDARGRVRRVAAALEGAGFRCDLQLYGGEESLPTTDSVRDALLSGYDLAVHVGHGSNESWHGCLGPAERDALAEAPPAIYFSVGCSTGHFCAEAPYHAYLDEDEIPHHGTNAGEVFTAPPPPPACFQPGRFNSTGLGERLIRMPTGGAVVYVGCNTGAQPCALSLLEGFTAGLAPGERAGDAWRQALAHYWRAERLAELRPTDSWYPPSIFFQGMKFMFFGDPTLRISGE